MLNKVRYYVIYQITNLLNNHIYIGAHQTYNIYDKYMGSSKYLKKDLKELGRKNFQKDILFVFNNKEDMIAKEAELVNKEFCYRVDTYNKMIGGISEMSWTDMISVKDKNGNNFKVFKDDPRYLSGELVHNTKGMVTVRDNNGNTFNVSIDDERFLSGELNSIGKNKIIVLDENNDKIQIDKNDPRYLSGELKSWQYNLVIVKDGNGNKFQVSVDDPRYLSGELVHIWKDRKHSEEAKEKMSKSSKGIGIGNTNSQYGTCWITNNIENKKIKKEELDQYLNTGWSKGRKLKD